MTLRNISALITTAILAGSAFVYADQQTAIESEDARIRSRMTAKGFACRENAPQGNSDKFDTRIAMAKHTIYYMALITGNGSNTARTKALTLINQRKSVKKLEFQNTPFGTELSIKPNSEGEKLMKFELTKKSDYRFTLCTIQASIYRIDDGMPAIQDYGNF